MSWIEWRPSWVGTAKIARLNLMWILEQYEVLLLMGLYIMSRGVDYV